MYASTGDTRFKAARGLPSSRNLPSARKFSRGGFHAGYLSAFPESFIDRVEQGQPVWAPWYTLHKIMAGLLDAYQLAGNAQALDVLTNMAGLGEVPRGPAAARRRCRLRSTTSTAA